MKRNKTAADWNVGASQLQRSWKRPGTTRSDSRYLEIYYFHKRGVFQVYFPTSRNDKCHERNLKHRMIYIKGISTNNIIMLYVTIYNVVFSAPLRHTHTIDSEIIPIGIFSFCGKVSSIGKSRKNSKSSSTVVFFKVRESSNFGQRVAKPS